MKTRKIVFIIVAVLLLAALSCSLAACNDADSTLKSVTNIDCDGYTITWQHEDFGTVNGLVFKVTIGDTTETVNALSYQYDAQNSDFTVEIEAVYQGQRKLEKDKSGGSVTKAFKALPAIQNVRMSDDVLVWDAVENATSYVVRIEQPPV